MMICSDDRECFAKRKGVFDSYIYCKILTDGAKPYPKGECPFCKPIREVTNGVYYEFKQMTKDDKGDM